MSHAEGSWPTQAQACGGLDLLEGPRSSSRTTGYDRNGLNENLILARVADCVAYVSPGDPCRSDDSCGNKYNCWDHGAAILAMTLLTYDAQGRLLDTDIEINAFSYLTLVDAPPCTPGHISQSCVGNDVQNTVTHELGHALGLDHSPDPTSTMFDTAPIGETSKRVLDPESRQFICDVYPPAQASVDCFTGDDGTDGGGGAGGTGGTGGNSSGGSGSSSPGIARTGAGCSSAGDEELVLPALLGLVLAAFGVRARWRA